MADDNIGPNSFNANNQMPQGGSTGGLTDAPEKSALERAVPPKEIGSAPASSAMPEATPSAQPGLNNATTEGGEEEGATVPDTDKFLESILNSTENSPDSEAPAPVAPQPPLNPPIEPASEVSREAVSSPMMSPNTENLNSNTESIQQAGGSDDGLGLPSNDSLNSTFAQPDTPQSEPVTPQGDNFLQSFSSNQGSDIPINQAQETSDSSIPGSSQSGIGAMDSVAGDIRQPEEPPRSIVDSPPAMMPPKPPVKKSSRSLVIAFILILAVVAAYLLYNSFFAAQDSYQTSDTQEDFVSDEAEESYLTQSNDEVRKNDLAKIYQALKSYYSATGKYPYAASRVSLNNSDNVLEKELVAANYITVLPADPDADKYYAYKSDGSTFSLTAVLDDEADPEATVIDSLPIYEITEETVSVNSSSENEDVYLPEDEDYSSNPFYPSGSSQSDI